MERIPGESTSAPHTLPILEAGLTAETDKPVAATEQAQQPHKRRWLVVMTAAAAIVAGLVVAPEVVHGNGAPSQSIPRVTAPPGATSPNEASGPRNNTQSPTEPSGNGSSNPSGVPAPRGNLPGWQLRFVDNFTGNVPVGAFSDCTNDNNGPRPGDDCSGLKQYPDYYKNWWAYPSGWDDTAEECVKRENGCPDSSANPTIGGEYQPEKAVSVSDGVMHIHIYRPPTGNNVVATVVPLGCMGQQYGIYEEEWKTTQSTPLRFKMAHLFYQDQYEMDFPENGNGNDEQISAFTHTPSSNDAFPTHATFGDGKWHNTKIVWTQGSIQYYMDGRLIGTSTEDIPQQKMSWALQNESTIEGKPGAQPGDWAQVDEDWVACYAQSS